MKNLIALALLLVPASAALAENEGWYLFYTTGNGTFMYARSEDMLKGRSDQTSAKVWVKMDHKNDSTTADEESRTLFQLNCPEQTYRTLAIFTRKPGEKNQTQEYVPFNSGQYIMPDSVMEVLSKDVCTDPE